MRYAAVMTFDFEADSSEQAMERVRDFQVKVTRASQKLGIGFLPGTVTAQPQPEWRVAPEPCPDEDPETLFDADP